MLLGAAEAGGSEAIVGEQQEPEKGKIETLGYYASN